jgi:hypothetical protein
MFKPTVGAADITYRSKSEAAISLLLQEYGIVSHDAYYPQTFYDSKGTEFRAMSDFQCPYTGIYFESKSGHMNGLQTKVSADNAMARFNDDYAFGRISSRNYSYRKLDASWSASAMKFSHVQDQVAESGGCAVLIFEKQPDVKTVGRLERAKVFWCVYGDEYFRRFMSFRALAKHGFCAEYTIKGHLFNTHTNRVRSFG